MILPPLRFGVSTLAAGLLAGLMSSALADNLIPNPGFESGMDGWEVFLGPEFRSTGAVYEGKVQEGVFHEGSAAVALNTDVPIRYGISSTAKNPIPVDGGARYKVTGWVKFSDDAVLQPNRGSVYLRLALLDAPGHATEDPLGNIHIGLDGKVARTPDVAKLVCHEIPRDWQKIEAVVDIPEGQNYVVMGLFADRISGTAYWDDISLERVEKDTPLSPVLTKN